MKRLVIFIVSLCALIFSCGCNNKYSSTQQTTEGKVSSVSLGSGLTLSVEFTQADSGVLLTYGCVSDNTVYSLSVEAESGFTKTLPLFDVTLVNKTTGEEHEPVSDNISAKNAVRFDVPYKNIENYILKYNAEFLLAPISLSSVTVNLGNAGINKRIELPDDHFIEVNSAYKDTRNGQLYACINYSIDSYELICEVNVLKSKVGTGVSIGEIIDNGGNNYTYCHPIRSGESELVIRFEPRYHKTFSGEIIL